MAGKTSRTSVSAHILASSIATSGVQAFRLALEKTGMSDSGITFPASA
jgi:hypothetical protein